MRTERMPIARGGLALLLVVLSACTSNRAVPGAPAGAAPALAPSALQREPRSMLERKAPGPTLYEATTGTPEILPAVYGQTEANFIENISGPILTNNMAADRVWLDTPTGYLFVHPAAITIGNPSISVYASPPGPDDLTALLPSSIQGSNLAFDSVGDAFVTAGGGVSEYQPPFTGAPVLTLKGGPQNELVDVAVDSQNNLYVLGNAKIAKYAAGAYGTPVASATLPTPNQDPAGGIALDNAGHVFAYGYDTFYKATAWVNEFDATTLALLHTVSGLSPIATREADPIAVDANGDLFVLEPSDIGVYTAASGYAQRSATVPLPSSQTAAFNLDPSGNLWIPGGSSLVEYAPPYTSLTRQAPATPNGQPTDYVLIAYP